MIPVSGGQRDAAQRIIDEVAASFDEDEGVGYLADIDDNGVWIRHDESINPEHVATLVEALVNGLELPGVHIVAWAYTCSRLRLDEFGGGAFAVVKGRNTVWVDAQDEARRQAELDFAELKEIARIALGCADTFDDIAESMGVSDEHLKAIQERLQS